MNYGIGNKYKLGVAVYRYKIEVVLLDKALNTLHYAIAELPKGFDPLPHTAELIRNNIPRELINNLHSIGGAFSGYIDGNQEVLIESFYFPEYQERPFLEELKLALQIPGTPASLFNPAECDFCYGRTFMNIRSDLMALSLKQGIFAKVEVASWQKLVDWEKIGHTPLKIAENNLCVCGGKSCLETVAGDIATVKKYAGKYGFKNTYINVFLTAFNKGDSRAISAFNDNVNYLLSALDFENNFYNQNITVLIGSNIIQEHSLSFDKIVAKKFKKIKRIKPSFIVADEAATVIGAALACGFYSKK